MKEKIKAYILNQLKEYREEGLLSKDLSFSDNVILYGKNGLLSSFNLITLVVDVEGYVNEEFNVPVTIADERAFSERNSPFATIESLATYTEKLIKSNEPA